MSACCNVCYEKKCFCENKSREIFLVISEQPSEQLFVVKNCFDFYLFDRVLVGILKHRARADAFQPIERPLEVLYELSDEFGHLSIFSTAGRIRKLSAQIIETLEESACENSAEESDLFGHLLHTLFQTEISQSSLLKRAASLEPERLNSNCCEGLAFVKTYRSRVVELFRKFCDCAARLPSEQKVQIIWVRNDSFRKKFS